MQKHRVTRNLHVIARMLQSITRRTMENKIGGDWFTIEELPDRRTNGQFVTYKENLTPDKKYGFIVPSDSRYNGQSKQIFRDKTGTTKIMYFCKELGEGRPLFEGRNWTEVFQKMEVYAHGKTQV
jgi:hypothetical protein